MQNTGKNTINKLHKVTCEILKLPDDYGSHSWRHTTATVQADAGASKGNSKRYRQWASNVVVEDYIANSKPLCMECLDCLLPESKRKKEEVRQENTELVKYNQVVKLTKDVVDLQNLSKKEKEPPEKSLTLYGFSQFDDPDYAIVYLDSTTGGVPVLCASKVKPGPMTVARNTKDMEVDKSSNAIKSLLSSSGANFTNCTFVFNN